jgi:hypothetical protein
MADVICGQEQTARAFRVFASDDMNAPYESKEQLHENRGDAICDFVKESSH